MCGRFADHLAWEEEWIELLGDWPASVTPSFNKAPTAQVAAFTAAGGYAMRWGLVPAWSRQPTTKYATFNARVEEVSRKPAYRSAWKAQRRCLIPVLGYYEWQRKASAKQPYFIHEANGVPLLLGGLWEAWSGDDERLLSCTVLTREPVARIAEIHDRMPVVVRPERLEDWLTGNPAAALEIAAEMSRGDSIAMRSVVMSIRRRTTGRPAFAGRTVITLPDLARPFGSQPVSNRERPKMSSIQDLCAAQEVDELSRVAETCSTDRVTGVRLPAAGRRR